MRGGGRRMIAAAALLAALPAAAGERAKVEAGNQLYLAGDLEGALREYTEAQVDLPDSPALHYNIGNVWFRRGDYAQAVDEYRRAATGEDPALAARAQFNAGNALYLSEDYEAAAEMYRQVLLQDPADEGAKRNLELALRAAQEPPPPPSPQGGEGDESPPQEGAEQPSPPRPEPGEGEEQPSGEGEEPPPAPPESPSPGEGSSGEAPRTPPPDASPGQGDARRQASAEAQPLPAQEAERLLDALREEEKQNLRRALVPPRRGPRRGKDW